MKKLRKVMIMLLVLIIVAFIFTKPILRFLGNWVVVEEPLQAVDVIVVLSGEKGERVEQGVKLYQQGYGDKLIMTGGLMAWNTSAASIMKKQAASLGVDSQDIILEEQATTTYENAVYTKDIVLEKGYQSMLLVTSPYHMRRSLYIFKKVFRDTNVTIIPSPAENAAFNPDLWWEDDDSIKKLGLEYLKFIWYFFKY